MGRDKAFLEVDGTLLWQRQIQLLESLAPEQIFLAGGPEKGFERAGCQIVSDVGSDAGPLGGLIAAMRICESSFLLALAVDLPRMTARCLINLLNLCANDCGIVSRTDRLEPLVAVYPMGARELAEEQLAQGRYALRQFVRRCLQDGLMCEHSIDSADAPLFLNVNTPADWQAASCRQ